MERSSSAVALLHAILNLKHNYCQAYRYMVAQKDRTETVLADDDEYMNLREF